ncbi:MAG TPA: hypothetical protein VJB89_02910 [Candidatus Nanoarchaeia archaeon]|nr:hypothetical protein [Candidatus Nanoarchaeia archaeon]
MRSKKGMDTIWSFLTGLVIAIVVTIVLVSWLRSCTKLSECENLPYWEGLTKELISLDNGKISESNYFFINNNCKLTSFIYSQGMNIHPESLPSLEKPSICLCKSIEENTCLFDRNRCFIFKNIKGINTQQFTTKDYGETISLKLSRKDDQLTIVPEGTTITTKDYTIPVTVKDNLSLESVSLIIESSEIIKEPEAYISPANCIQTGLINLDQKQICFKIDKITSELDANIELSPLSIKRLSLIFTTKEIGTDKIPVYYSQEKSSIYTKELIPQGDKFILIHNLEGLPSSFLITEESCLNFKLEEQKSSEELKLTIDEEAIGFKYLLNKDLKGSWVFTNYYKLKDNKWLIITTPSKEQLVKKEEIQGKIKDLDAASGYPLIIPLVQETIDPTKIKEITIPINEIILTQNNPSCKKNE